MYEGQKPLFRYAIGMEIYCVVVKPDSLSLPLTLSLCSHPENSRNTTDQNQRDLVSFWGTERSWIGPVGSREDDKGKKKKMDA